MIFFKFKEKQNKAIIRRRKNWSSVHVTCTCMLTLEEAGNVDVETIFASLYDIFKNQGCTT